eukprot:scaffold1138_cov128-Cylindrotheca_fusiformis.AAC.28
MIARRGRGVSALLLIALILDLVAAFAPKVGSRSNPMNALFATSPQLKADFEYQELKILSKAIVEQKVPNSRVPPEKRVEIEGYCRRVVNRRESPIPLYELSGKLSGTWQQVFTTQTLNLESLPKDAIIKLEFKDDARLDYILEFTKAFGLERLVANSSYTIDVRLPVSIANRVRPYFSP